MQCQRCPINQTQVHLSALETTRGLIQEQGLSRLFRGVNTMLTASIPAHAAYFSIFEACKLALDADGPEHTPLKAGLAGVAATVAHDAIMTPMDVVKQRLQLGYYGGTLDCLERMIRHEGPGALFRSFPTTLVMNVPYGMVVVASNETCKRVLNPTGEHHAGAYFASGAISGALAGALTNPLDVVKTRLQTQSMKEEKKGSGCATNSSTLGRPSSVCGLKNNVSEGSEPKLELRYKGLVDAGRQILREEGMRGFFRGMFPRLLVHTPSVAVSWTTYEAVKHSINKWE